LTDYIASGWVTGLMPETIRAAFVNGMPAATARASADRWDFDVTVVRNGPKIYRFLTAVPKGNTEALTATAQQAAQDLPADDAARSRPTSSRCVSAWSVVKPGENMQTLSDRMLGTDRKLELFRLLNGLPLGATVSAGDKVKIISE
jgi:predicted Zn-dependent protease